MRRPLRLWIAAFLAGCGGGNEKACELPTYTAVPQECTGLSRENWRIGPYPIPSENELRLEVGQSRSLFLDPFVEPQCADTIASVTWSVDDPSSASVVPQERAYRGAWVTGLSVGANAVRAQLVFSDGTAQTSPRAIQVVASDPPAGSVVVAEGTLSLESRTASASPDYRRFIPFTLPRNASQTAVRVDWTSPLNNVTVSFFQGERSGPASAPCVSGLRFITGSSADNVKPQTLLVRDLPADTYTLRIDNLGPGAETIRWEVRLSPS